MPYCDEIVEEGPYYEEQVVDEYGNVSIIRRHGLAPPEVPSFYISTEPNFAPQPAIQLYTFDEYTQQF